MSTPLTTHDWMELSAYLDEQMVPTQRAKLEQRLKAEPALRNELEEMRRLRTVLRSLKPRKVPHNFTLTRQMAMERRRSPLVPWLGWSSVLSSLLLIFSLFLRMNLSFGAQAPMMKEMALPEAASMDQATPGQQMPMILNWSGPLGIGGGSGQPENSGINAAQPMGGAEGKGGGGGPPAYANQQPFIGFPLPGTDVTPSDNAAPNTQMRVVEQPTGIATQRVEASATQAPAVQSAAPAEGQQEPSIKAVEMDAANILGLPQVEEQGTMRVLETTTDTTEVQPSQSSVLGAWLQAWWLSLLLLVLAIGSGATALLLRRKRP